MKQLIVRPIGQFFILVTLVFSQFVFADAPLKKDDDSSTICPNKVIQYRSIIETSSYANDITIDIVGTELMISFNSPIGIATVSINDKKGNLVYQTIVDTDNTSESSVPVSFFKSGSYTVTVSSDSNVYSELIQL